MSDLPVSPEDIRAAAETYQELGPEYHDAVVASFLAKVDREVAARVEARLAAGPAAPPARRKRGLDRSRRRTLRDVTAGAAGALAVVAAVAVAGVHHSGGVGPSPQWEVRRAVPGGIAGPHQVILDPANGRVEVPQPKLPQPPAAPKG
jgi:hypothetical protein